MPAYEKKLTSYPRSDCDYLPENQLSEAGAILAHLSAQDAPFAAFAQKADTKIKSRAWDDKKISAHHAIIPTTVKASLQDLSEKERNLYGMVAKAYVAQFFPPQEFLATHVEAAAGGESFLANGKVITRQGWKEIYAGDERKQKKEDDGEQERLPAMREGDALAFATASIKDGITKPPSRYTEATLLAAMKEIHKHVKDKNLAAALKECSGIGTEATRAGIIEGLLKRGFLAKKGKELLPAELATSLVRILPEALIYPDLTARWEDLLDQIGKQSMSLSDFAKEQEVFIDELLRKAKDTEIPPPKNIELCPICKKPMRRRKGKTGYFWGCTGYPDCKATFPDKNGKPDKDASKRQRRLANASHARASAETSPSRAQLKR